MNEFLITLGAIWFVVCTAFGGLWLIFDKGKDAQKAKSDETALKEISKANNARRAVRDTDGLQHDEFNRDNRL